MAAHLEVQGAKQLRASLKQAGADMAEMKTLHANVAGVVVEATRPPRRSGRLAASVRGTGQAAAAVVRAGGAKVPYANVIEWGWPRRGITPRHYLTGAAKHTEPRWFDMYVTEVQRICDTVRGA